MRRPYIVTSHVVTPTFDSLRMFYRVAYPVSFVAWPVSTQVLVGSGGTVVAEDVWSGTTGATHASSGGNYRVIRLPGTAATHPINWNKKLWVGFRATWISGGSAANLTMRLQITQATAIGDLAAHGLGMQTNGANINLASYGTGGSQALESAATNLADSDPVFILIEHDPASADRLYINGVLKAQQTTAANIPSTEPAANYNIFASIARSGGADTGNENFTVTGLFYGQEL